MAARGRVGVGEHQKAGVGVVRELSYYDSVLECAVCGECAQDLASDENELNAAGIASPV